MQEMTEEEQRNAFFEHQRQQKETNDERKALELSFQVANREEKRATQEMKELEAAAKEFDEHSLPSKRASPP